MAYRARDYGDYSGALDIATASGDTSSLRTSGAVVWYVNFSHKGTSSAQFELNDNTASGARDTLKMNAVCTVGRGITVELGRPIHFNKGIIYFVTGTGALVEVGYLGISSG